MGINIYLGYIMQVNFWIKFPITFLPKCSWWWHWLLGIPDIGYGMVVTCTKCYSIQWRNSVSCITVHMINAGNIDLVLGVPRRSPTRHPPTRHSPTRLPLTWIFTYQDLQLPVHSPISDIHLPGYSATSL